MFRFTMRELLLLTVIVALGFGWFLREGHFRSDEEALRAQSNVLEHVLTKEGVRVKWSDDRTMVTIVPASTNAKAAARALYVPAFR